MLTIWLHLAVKIIEPLSDYEHLLFTLVAHLRLDHVASLALAVKISCEAL